MIRIFNLWTLAFLAFLIASPIFANGFFATVAGGYQQNHSGHIESSSDPVAGATALTSNPIALQNSVGLFSIGAGYTWQWQKFSLSPALMWDRSSNAWSGAPVLADATLPANAFSTRLAIQDILVNTQLNYLWDAHWSGFIAAAIGMATIQTDATFFFAAPPLPAQDEKFNSFKKTVFQLGLGVDYALTPQWNIGTGIFYRDYGNLPLGTFYQNPPITDGVNMNLPHYHTGLVLVNLAYHFNPF